jgi:hypothetical protein
MFSAGGSLARTAVQWPSRGPSSCRVGRSTLRTEVIALDDLADRFLELIHGLEEVRDAITPEQAHTAFDETTLQVFWLRWPSVSLWAGSLWRMLSDEMGGPASPHLDTDLDEVGGSD